MTDNAGVTPGAHGTCSCGGAAGVATSGAARRSAGRRWLWIVAGLAAAGAAAAAVGIWHLPPRMYPDPGDTDARAALQGGLLTAASALIAVAGALVALDETRAANTETRRANEAADERERQAYANTHVRELYTRAIDQLGSDSDTIRLGGIYALERIVADSPADRRAVVEVLAAFVRTLSTDPRRAPAPAAPAAPSARPGRRGPSRPPAVDIRAAVGVLARLPHPADLTGADLTGLTGLTNHADLPGAPSLAHLTLTNATLADARLAGVDFTGGSLDDADLARADLRRANLTDAELVDADLTGARLADATLAGALLFRATLTGAQLGRADLTGAQLGGADLTNAVLDEAILADAVLSGANLTNARLDGADLTAATGLAQKQVDSARGDRRTHLPAGLARPASWDTAEGPAGQ
ncbi:Pentapeptide repeat protein [Parafrankia sp. Ea1.12]|uniref:pentapeptide repeat-containing protein n=1 Tax=Parafrankia sp. Ea1.12 TaxID=573499 RepID=UPI000DA46184|nr:pentapeptide repeat-containing protein [Parafrankia sp. Ea1.12]SQD95440.1 Pentapeptide repeat protein [Parafrankia sp. Ea1.12]